MRNNPNGMKNHPVVSHDEWLSARKAFLAKEKEFTRMRDELSRQRRARSWDTDSHDCLHILKVSLAINL